MRYLALAFLLCCCAVEDIIHPKEKPSEKVYRIPDTTYCDPIPPRQE